MVHHAANVLVGFVPIPTTTNRGYQQIVNITYTPLTKEQADLYMTMDEYTRNLQERIYNDLHFKDLDGRVVKPWIHPLDGQNRLMTTEEVEKVSQQYKESLQKEDKIILMTKGINGIPRAQPMPYRVRRTTVCNAFLLSLFCGWIPCCFGNVKRVMDDLKKDEEGKDIICKRNTV
jgi:hypothetical protein